MDDLVMHVCHLAFWLIHVFWNSTNMQNHRTLWHLDVDSYMIKAPTQNQLKVPCPSNSTITVTESNYRSMSFIY